VLLTKVGDRLVREWGAGYHRSVGLGEAWASSGPGIIPGTQVLFKDIGAGQKASVAVSRRGGLAIRVTPKAEVVLISSSMPSGLLRASGADLAIGPAEYAVCTLAGGCVCPSQSVRPDTRFINAGSDDVMLGLSGDRTGGGVALSGWTLKDFCFLEPPLPVACQLVTDADIAGVFGEPTTPGAMTFGDTPKYESSCEWFSRKQRTVYRGGLPHLIWRQFIVHIWNDPRVEPAFTKTRPITVTGATDAEEELFSGGAVGINFVYERNRYSLYFNSTEEDASLQDLLDIARLITGS
jgi:hypothetical protein